MIYEELYNQFHKRVEELTGDPWCPYPSDNFMMAILKAQDHTAKYLINYRRTLQAPNFFGKEPQQEDIEIILTP